MSTTSAPSLLNPDRLANDTVYPGLHPINMRQFLRTFEPIVDELFRSGHIAGNDSIGFAMAAPVFDDELNLRFWDDPYGLVWFAGGWGPRRSRYVAEAARMLRPLARSGHDSTLEMVEYYSAQLRDQVPSQDGEGNFPWGDFAQGGAVMCRSRDLTLLGAVSGLEPAENDYVTRLILAVLAQKLFKVNLRED